MAVSPPRPELLVAVLGTATEVGKTWTSAQVLTELRGRGITVAARKPAQSFDPSELGGTDAEVLALATGEPVEAICPAHRWYEVPMAPPMAAAVLGRDRISTADVIDEICWPAGVAIGFVETVGGVRSPFTEDADSAELAALLAPDRVLLVADSGLGTINAVRLSLQAIGSVPTLVFLNRFDGSDLHQRNRTWLDSRDGCATAVDIAEVCAWLDSAVGG